MIRYDLAAQLGDVTVSHYDMLRTRLEMLDEELPRLASLVAEVAFWRCVLDADVPHTSCAVFLIYRDALTEYNDIQAELVAIGAFLVA